MTKKVSFINNKIVTTILILLVVVSAVFYKDLLEAKLKNDPDMVLNQVKARQELRVGMLRSLTTQYIDYRNPNKVGGFEHDLLDKLAQSLHVKLTLIFANSLPELVEKIANNEIDFIASEMKGYTSQKNNFIATIPFHYSNQQVIYLKGSKKPYSFSDIDNNNLSVAKNSLQSYVVNRASLDYPTLIWQELDYLNKEDLLKLVADKKIDYTIADNWTVSIMQRIYPSLAIAFEAVNNQPTAWYFPKNRDLSLLKKTDKFIAHSINNGLVDKLEYRYFSYMDQFDYVDTRAFIRAIDKTLPKYETYFRKNGQDNNIDWKLLAAISYQESHWNPKAISSTGVRGMMMLTKSTAESLGITNRLDAEQSIQGGSTYIAQMIARIPKTVPKEERVWFALAAYNMGIGHLWDARTLATQLGKNPNSWQDIRQVLPLLTEEEYYSKLKYGFARGYQAIHFVDSIQQYYISIVGYRLEKEHRQKEIDRKKHINLDKDMIINQ